MKTLQIEIPEGFKIDTFDTATGQIKFTPIPKSIFERIKTLQDAIDELGERDEEVIELRKLENTGIVSHILYHQQAVVVAKALQEDWVADFSDSDQKKYTAYYKVSSAGGFVYHGFDYWHTVTDVCSRLCFSSLGLAKYFGTQFIEIHNKYL